MLPECGRAAGTALSTTRVPNIANRTPDKPPRPAMMRLSVSSCITIRRRRAPIATRNANSPERRIDRASNKLATFVQAIRSRNPTAARSINRTGPHIAYQIFAHRNDTYSHALVRFRICDGKIQGDGTHLRARLLGVTPGLSRPTACELKSTRRPEMRGLTTGQWERKCRGTFRRS